MISRILWVRNQSRSGLSSSSSSGPLRWLCRQAGATLILRFPLGRTCFQIYSVVAFSSMWAFDQKPPLAPCYMWASQQGSSQPGIWPLSERRVRDQMRRLSFYKLTSEVTSHHFCCMLLSKSQSLGPTHTQRVDYQDVGSLADISEATRKIH